MPWFLFMISIILISSTDAGILEKLSIDILDPSIAEYLTDNEIAHMRLVNKNFNKNIDPKYQQRLSLENRIYTFIIPHSDKCCKYIQAIMYLINWR